MLNKNNHLLNLKKQLSNLDIDFFLLPNNDEFMSEYLPESEKRLEFVTGFAGSNGFAVIGQKESAFFTDGRYVLQAAGEVDKNDYETFNLSDKSPLKWLLEKAQAGQKIGFDPKLHSVKEINSYQEQLKQNKIELVQIAQNPIDEIWNQKPEAARSSLFVHDLQYCGKNWQDKISQIIGDFEDQADCLLLTSPASICWLFNIRGSDIAYTPLALCYAAIYKDGSAELFIDQDRLDQEVKDHLEGVAILPLATLSSSTADVTTIFPPVILSLEGLLDPLNEGSHASGEILESCNDAEDPSLRAAKSVSKLRMTGKIQIDLSSCNYWLYSLLSSHEIIDKTDPCSIRKATKNETEIAGAIKAHEIDGLALTKFLSWLDKSLAQGQEMDEKKAADKLLEFRQQNKEFFYPSFGTISSFGSNGAIIHYQFNEKSNKKFEKNGLYLLDSGGQYQEGTTDVTRTIVIGTPTAEQITDFTLVLKGHIGVATSELSEKTTGKELDDLARKFLQKAGKDYEHGTGHGVGSFLGVHESPPSISKRADNVTFKPGMIVSNEPGYYKNGEYGIRIESLLLVEKAPDDKSMKFRTLTLAPIDLRLIDFNMLDEAEQKWLKNYHLEISQKLGSALTAEENKWLDSYSK